MKLSTHSFRVIAVSILLSAVSACAPVTAPAPVSVTSSASETASITRALVAFPTAAPETPAPAVPTASLAEPHAAPNLPLVQIASPISNTQVSISQTLPVSIYAADDAGIARIELYDDNALVSAEDAPTPAPPVFSAIVPWTPSDIGSHTLRAIAYNTTNRASAAEEVSISVTPDTRRPTVLILFPLGTPQVELGSVLQLQIAAIDEVGVTQLELLVDNQPFTYILSPSVGGESPFPTTFSWPALTLGAHTLVVRAHDNQDQTNDSAPLKVQVVDTHAPSLSVTFDRTNAPANEPITITLAALDVSGIARIELWVGKEIASVTTSANPARQTSMTVQTAWQNATAGDYSIYARAYNANGNFKESPPQTISILRPGQSTPTRASSPTPTRTRAPRATATPRLQPPAPPKAELILPNDKFVATSPLRVTFGGIGNAELDHIELWGYAQDQPMPQLICSIDARATTQKNAQCDWTPIAGVVYLFAQAVDSYHQVARSPTISGVIGVPTLPTPSPTPASIAGRWNAPAFTATLRQSGTTLRGEFKATIAGKDIDGRIASGTIRNDQVTFRVEFPAPSAPTATPISTSTPGTETLTPVATLTTTTPSPSATPTLLAPLAPTMDFDCAMDAAITTLSCNWKDARGQGGSTLFRRESSTP